MDDTSRWTRCPSPAHGFALVRGQGVEQLVGSVGSGVLGQRNGDGLRTVKVLLQAESLGGTLLDRAAAHQ